MRVAHLVCLITAISLTMTTTACKKKQAEPSANDPASEARMVGTWEADMSSLRGEALDAMPAEQRAQIMAVLAGGSMTVTFNADGTYSSQNVEPNNQQPYSDSGTWEVLSSVGNVVEFRTTELVDSRGAEELDEEPTTVTLTFNGSDQMTLAGDTDGGGEMTMTLNRR